MTNYIFYAMKWDFEVICILYDKYKTTFVSFIIEFIKLFAKKR